MSYSVVLSGECKEENGKFTFFMLFVVDERYSKKSFFLKFMLVV